MKKLNRTSVSTVLAAAIMLPLGAAVAAPPSADTAATIVSQQLPWHHTTIYLGTAQEARILEIDGKRSDSFYSASLAAGSHTLRVATSCWYQVIERVDQTTMTVELEAGQRYKLAVDVDQNGECVASLVQLEAGEEAPSSTSGKGYRVQSSPTSLMSIM